jgi:hypothetical protein
VKNWKKRYFKLKGNTLFYYEAPSDNNPLGGINLPEFSLHLAEAKMKKEFCFELRHSSARCYFLQAISLQSLREWLCALFNAISLIDEEVVDKYLSSPLSPTDMTSEDDDEAPPSPREQRSSSGSGSAIKEREREEPKKKPEENPEEGSGSGVFFKKRLQIGNKSNSSRDF